MSIKIDGSPELVKTLPAFGNLQYYAVRCCGCCQEPRPRGRNKRTTGYLVDSATRLGVRRCLKYFSIDISARPCGDRAREMYGIIIFGLVQIFVDLIFDTQSLYEN